MRRTTIVALAATVLLTAACSADTGSDAASSSGPGAPAPAPASDTPAPEQESPAPSAPELADRWPGDLSVEELVALGVMPRPGFSPHEHLGRTGGIGMLNWPPEDQMPQGIGDPPVPDGLGPLVIDARIERFPISCLQWTRTIGAVDVGEGEAARAIADAIVAMSDDEHARFSGWYGVEEDCDDLDPASVTSRGDTYHELREEPCALPEGPDVRCFVLAAFGYPPGAAHTYLRHHQLVFDTVTGERLELAELFAGGGVDADMGLQVTEEVVRIVTALDLVRIRQARPTAAGLVFGFSPYEAGGWSDYTRDVTIPWHVYRMAERADRDAGVDEAADQGGQ